MVVLKSQLNLTVFTSPEIAIEKSFAESVLKAQEFTRKLCLLAIDEAHVVEEWSTFRPAYLQLAVLRARLPEGVPLLAASATLTEDVIEELKTSCAFRRDARTIKTPLDRPEIFLQVTPARYPMASLLDLQHLLPSKASKPQDIPKTIVFVDSCATAIDAVTMFAQWMVDLCYPEMSRDWVKSYFAPMAGRDKKVIAQQFKRISTECQEPRILVSTEAYGMGIDNPDIQRVVQWLVPSSMTKIYQRGGRAGRNGVPGAMFLVICEPRLIGDRSLKRSSQPKNNSDNEIQSRLTDAERRGRLSTGLWELINARDGQCLREIGLNHFDAVDKARHSRATNDRCCSNCQPHLTINTEMHRQLIVEEHKWKSMTPWLRSALTKWRQIRLSELSSVWLQSSPEYFMSDRILNALATKGYPARSELDLRRITDNEWGCLSEYGPDLLQIFQRCRDIPFTRGSETFEAWTAGLGKRSALSAATKRPSQKSRVLSAQQSSAIQCDTQLTLIPTQLSQPDQLPRTMGDSAAGPDTANSETPRDHVDSGSQTTKKLKRRRAETVVKTGKLTREPLKEIFLQSTKGGRVRRLPQKYSY